MSDMVERVARQVAELGPRDTFHYNYDTHADEYREIARAAIEACAAEIDALVERRKADKRNQGNDHILATAAFLRHAALKGEAE